MFNIPKQFAKNDEFDLATIIFVSAPQPGILCLNSPHRQNVWPKMVLCSTARPRNMRPLEVRTSQLRGFELGSENVMYADFNGILQ